MIEIMRFRLAPGADAEAFLAADKTLQSDFAYHRRGLLRRTTASGDDGSWIVIDLWRTPEDADATAEAWDADPVAAAFMSFVDAATVETQRYTELD